MSSSLRMVSALARYPSHTHCALDPYYFLQYSVDASPIASALTPSFLSMDVDGRVIRLDSLSKIMAPGLRLGWLTSGAAFHEHLVALTDSSTQHPHGFGQIFLAELLGEQGWQLAGFDRWVRSLRAEYRRRRDFFLGVFEREVGRGGLASARAPQAGMFVWIRVHVERHPRYRVDAAPGGTTSGARTNVAQLIEELFRSCLDDGLVIVPASVFALSGDPSFDHSAIAIEDVSTPGSSAANWDLPVAPYL